jgi:hypothetical protein
MLASDWWKKVNWSLQWLCTDRSLCCLQRRAERLAIDCFGLQCTGAYIGKSILDWRLRCAVEWLWTDQYTLMLKLVEESNYIMIFRTHCCHCVVCPGCNLKRFQWFE